jgi:hypothetical protein
MKHLCRHSESQFFNTAVIQPVFDHFNYLISDVCHCPLLAHVLPQQTIEVLFGAAFPTGKGPGQVPRVSNAWSMGMTTPLFAVAVSLRIDPGLEVIECLDDGRAYQIGYLI